MKKEDWTWGPYFHWSEFDDPKSMEPDSGLNMDPKFMDKLFSLRKNIGTAIAVHGAARGGYASGGHAGGSAHYLGLAADIFMCLSLEQIEKLKEKYENGNNHFRIQLRDQQSHRDS